MNNFFENLIPSESIRSIVLKLLLSIVVFISAKVLIYFFAKVLKKVVKTYKKNDHSNIKKVNSIVSILSSVFKYIIYFFVIVIILGIFGVNTYSLIYYRDKNTHFCLCFLYSIEKVTLQYSWKLLFLCGRPNLWEDYP